MRTLVAMSGGVDSSVAAALLVEQGHDVVGVTLKQWEDEAGNLPTAGCCTVGDAEDARRVAAQLGIPYYVLDYVDEFRRAVVEPFGRAYLDGRTPNPCVECNRTVRFNALLDRAAELGCDTLATGHYARVRWHPAGYRLLRGLDANKDQSYVLYMLDQSQLARVTLPVGELTKREVRAEAARLGLRTAAKPDSQEICFVGDGHYRDFLRKHFAEVDQPGPIVDTDGTVVGRHDGTAGFTVGQRRGLRVALQERKYVVAIRTESATVVIGDRQDLLAGGCVLKAVSFIGGRAPRDRRVEAKIRYRGTAVPATLEDNQGQWVLAFDAPQAAVAPGQAAVFYAGDLVVGGGTIERAV